MYIHCIMSLHAANYILLHYYMLHLSLSLYRLVYSRFEQISKVWKVLYILLTCLLLQHCGSISYHVHHPLQRPHQLAPCPTACRCGTQLLGQVYMAQNLELKSAETEVHIYMCICTCTCILSSLCIYMYVCVAKTG